MGDTGGTQKRQGPPERSAQGAASHGRPVLTGRNGEGAAARRSGTHKNEEAPCRLGRGPVSDRRLVLTSRSRESVAARRNGTHKNEEAPRRLGRGPRESSGDLLSRTRGPGTIGDLRLNFRVRDGNGCDPHSITAETISA